MTTATLERVAPSTPVTPALEERNNTMYTYQTPGTQRSDAGDGPRRIARTTALVNIMTIRVRTANHLASNHRHSISALSRACGKARRGEA